MTEVIHLRGESSVVCSFSLPLHPHIQGRLDKGDLVRVNVDGSPWVAPDEPGTEPEAPSGPLPDGAPPLPKRNESRAVWQQFAIGQGMDRDKAAAMTKAELVEEFTKPRDGD